jgi:hypothetical protein
MVDQADTEISMRIVAPDSHDRKSDYVYILLGGRTIAKMNKVAQSVRGGWLCMIRPKKVEVKSDLYVLRRDKSFRLKLKRRAPLQRHVLQHHDSHGTRLSPRGNHPRPYSRAKEAATAPEASAEMPQRLAGSHGSANACHHRVFALG